MEHLSRDAVAAQMDAFAVNAEQKSLVSSSAVSKRKVCQRCCWLASRSSTQGMPKTFN